MDKTLGFGTRALHAGKDKDERSHTPPIYRTASWEIRDAAQLQRGFSGELPIYARIGANPTIRYVEEKICSLEGGADARLRADGMGAVSMVIHGAMQTRDHAVVIGPIYGGTYDLLHTLKTRWGCHFTLISATDPDLPEKVARAVSEKTTMVFGEITANPTLAVWDVDAIAAQIKERTATINNQKPVSVAQERIFREFRRPILVVDSSFTSPYNFRPFEHGTDIVVHSATKYLGAHGAFLQGLAVVSEQCLREHPDVWTYANEWAIQDGGTPSAEDAWLLGQFMEDLPLRMPVHNKNAAIVAAFLEQHNAVASVLYPGLESYPQHELATRLLVTPLGEPGYGGMIAFRIQGGLAAAERFLYAVNDTIIKHKPSLGYTKTIVESPELLSQVHMPASDKTLFGLTPDLIRLSVGLEDVSDIYEALDYALRKSQRAKRSH